MMRPETLKILLVIALHKKWAIRQWDIVAAYLQALLHHDVYVSDINEKGEVEYWKLNKALYGLKQAGHEWFKTLEKILALAGLNQCVGDEGTYVNKEGSVIIGTHVNDLLSIAPNEKLLNDVEHKAEEHIELEKRGNPEKLLGMELQWNKEGTQVIMTQKALIESMTKAHLPNNPQPKKSLPSDRAMFIEEGEKLANPKPYQSLIGGLLYITRMTRLEISFHVNLLGRRTAKPSIANLQAVKQILQYLWTTKDTGLVLAHSPSLELTIYADSSYGGDECKSQTGVFMTLGNQPIGWYSRRQDIVALSITEAEYIADCEGAKDAAWTQQFLAELKIPLTPVLKTDSEGAYHLAYTSHCL